MKKVAFLSLSVALMLTLLAGAVFGQANQKNNVYRYLSIFSEVFDLVRSNYVEDVSSQKLMDGAFSGVTDAVDEFSYYVPPTQMAAYKNFVDVEDNGIGLVISKRLGYAYVIASVPGSPADKAGIERGDFVEKIAGQPTTSLSIWQVRSALRSNAPVKLQVLRGGNTHRDEVTVQPASFHPLAVSADTLSGIGYVRVPYFDKGTAAQLRTALESLRTKGVRKLIVDVRNNAGGSVDEAIASADEFLTSGTITTLEGRKLEPKQWQADRATDFDGDVEVLADASTAGPAEVFAGAIRGNNRGKVVGVTTYGKAIVQRFITLPSGGGVQMTVGHYTTPDLKPITDTGLKPDVNVDLTAEVLDEQDHKRHDTPDLILEKALELYGVKQEPAKKAA